MNDRADFDEALQSLHQTATDLARLALRMSLSGRMSHDNKVDLKRIASFVQLFSERVK